MVYGWRLTATLRDVAGLRGSRAHFPLSQVYADDAECPLDPDVVASLVDVASLAVAEGSPAALFHFVVAAAPPAVRSLSRCLSWADHFEGALPVQDVELAADLAFGQGL